MPDYKSLLISLRHAHNMCNSRVQQCSQLVDTYNGRLNELVAAQKKQHANSKNKHLGLNLNLYFKDLVEKRKERIKRLQERITTYKSIIADASRASKFLLDAIVMIETRTHDNFDFDGIIESIKYAISLNELRIKLYQKSESDFAEIITNQEKSANTQTPDTPSVNIKTFQNLVRRHNDIEIRHARDIQSLNVVLGMVLRYQKMKETMGIIQQSEYDANGMIR